MKKKIIFITFLLFFNFSPLSNAVSPLKQTSSQTLGFKIVNVAGDGNCFYRAVSRVLTGSEEFHLLLRNKTADYILKDDQSFLDRSLREEMAKEIKINGRCAEEIELATMASVENICLIVHGYRDGGVICDRVFGDKELENIHIQFVPNSFNPWGSPGHFKALIPNI